MWKTPPVTALVLAIGALSLTPPAAAAPDDAKAVVENASLAMGAAGLNAITYSGSAANGNFGQSRTISFGLASTTIRNYTRTIDFTQSTSHATGDPIPPAVRGGPPPQPGAPGSYDQLITPANAAWPKEVRPPTPVSSTRPRATSENRPM